MAPKDSSIAATLLSRAHSPDSAARIYTEKVKQRPLHLMPSTDHLSSISAQQHRRAERERKISQRKKHLKPPPLSSRQKRALCLYEIPKSAQKYEIYEPLNRLWVGYIQEVLGLVGDDNIPVRRRQINTGDAARLCSADFHGADIEVVRSRCVSRVGVQGIVVKDSMHVFELVTRKDGVKVIPKEGTVFKFCVPQPEAQKDEEGQTESDENHQQLVFELHGDQFRHRAADRANKKFKHHYLPYV